MTMTPDSAATLDTAPYQDEATDAPHHYDTKSPEAPPMAQDSYTPPDCDQFPWVVSHAILMGLENEDETLASVCETFEITIEQGLSALATTGKRISELVSAHPATVPPLAENG